MDPPPIITFECEYRIGPDEIVAQGEHAPGPEPLSPAAQAVLDAVREICPAPADEIAAVALRALAHHWRKENSGEYRTPFIQGMDSCAEEADEIATELEAQ
jgi:hypothetical protein